MLEYSLVIWGNLAQMQAGALEWELACCEVDVFSVAGIEDVDVL